MNKKPIIFAGRIYEGDLQILVRDSGELFMENLLPLRELDLGSPKVNFDFVEDGIVEIDGVYNGLAPGDYEVLFFWGLTQGSIEECRYKDISEIDLNRFPLIATLLKEWRKR